MHTCNERALCEGSDDGALREVVDAGVVGINGGEGWTIVEEGPIIVKGASSTGSGVTIDGPEVRNGQVE